MRLELGLYGNTYVVEGQTGGISFAAGASGDPRLAAHVDAPAPAGVRGWHSSAVLVFGTTAVRLCPVEVQVDAEPPRLTVRGRIRTWWADDGEESSLYL